MRHACTGSHTRTHERYPAILMLGIIAALGSSLPANNYAPGQIGRFPQRAPPGSVLICALYSAASVGFVIGFAGSERCSLRRFQTDAKICEVRPSKDVLVRDPTEDVKGKS